MRIVNDNEQIKYICLYMYINIEKYFIYTCIYIDKYINKELIANSQLHASISCTYLQRVDLSDFIMMLRVTRMNEKISK